MKGFGELTDDFWLGIYNKHGPSYTYWNSFVSALNRIAFIRVVLLWPGLEKIHDLTNTPTQYEVRFDIGSGSERVYAVYDNFKIAPAKQKFKLTIGNYKGNAGGCQYVMISLFLP